jgi:ferredoxin
MRIVHDRERCALHGQCTIAAPEIFRFDDANELVFEETPDESLRAEAQDAMDVCPERAIAVLPDDR